MTKILDPQQQDEVLDHQHKTLVGDIIESWKQEREQYKGHILARHFKWSFIRLLIDSYESLWFYYKEWNDSSYSELLLLIDYLLKNTAAGDTRTYLDYLEMKIIKELDGAQLKTLWIELELARGKGSITEHISLLLGRMLIAELVTQGVDTSDLFHLLDERIIAGD